MLSKSLRVVVATLITASVVLAVAQQQGGASPWWLELSRYLPYPVYLAAPLLALALSLVIGRWWVAASAVSVAITAMLTMDLHWQVRARELSPGAARLRLMTYNVKAYKAVERRGGLGALEREVALRNPDILVLQDAQSGPGQEPLRVNDGPLFGLPNVFVAHQYVVASRLPLQGCRARRTEPPDLDYVSCVVTVDGRPVNLVTVHFASPRAGLVAARHAGIDGIEDWRQNYLLRLLQSRALAADLEDTPQPLIVAGDLNAPDASPVIGNLLAIGLRDAFADAGTGYGYSYGQALPIGFSFLRIDHILVSGRIWLLDCFVGDAETSDHRPVIADLVLPRD